jgi:hypothetical protein
MGVVLAISDHPALRIERVDEASPDSSGRLVVGGRPYTATTAITPASARMSGSSMPIRSVAI